MAGRDGLFEVLVNFAEWCGDSREDAEWSADAFLSECPVGFIDRARAEAWDFGYACGLGDYGKRDDETRSANPYRTECRPETTADAVGDQGRTPDRWPGVRVHETVVSARLDNATVGDGCRPVGTDTHNPATNPGCRYAPVDASANGEPHSSDA